MIRTAVALVHHDNFTEVHTHASEGADD